MAQGFQTMGNETVNKALAV